VVLWTLRHCVALTEYLFIAPTRPRKFSRLANRNEARAEDSRHAAAEDESARFDSRNLRDSRAAVWLRELVNGALESARRTQKRCDVFEDDAGLWKIGNVADE